jgi:hypothetical protein
MGKPPISSQCFSSGRDVSQARNEATERIGVLMKGGGQRLFSATSAGRRGPVPAANMVGGRVAN